LITGASGGIGRALVPALAAAGWTVFAGVRERTAGAALERSGAGVTAVELDITDERSVGEAARTVAAKLGGEGLGGLVNNAGIIVQGPLELVPLHALRRSFEVNVIGQMAVTQAFLPFLRRSGGTIVNISAPTGRVTIPMLGPLSASKTALESLSDALRMELRHQGVNVAVIEPGGLQTPIFEKAASAAAADGFAGDPETQRYYGDALAAMDKALERSTAAGKPVDGVVKAIVKTLEASSPAARRAVGSDARAVMVLRRLPEGVRDRVLMRTFGLGSSVFG
jgi:NAD(P)-dependent dehydrogenase (short-subunit alcohol dehydrogenase family)